MLSPQALQMLSGAKSQSDGAASDPSQLPLQQQLPLIIKALSSRPLVRPGHGAGSGVVHNAGHLGWGGGEQEKGQLWMPRA